MSAATTLPERSALAHPAPWPAQGGYADGFRPVAERFAARLAAGEEIGAGLAVHHRGELVVDLWGGVADVATGRPWRSDTRIVLFSVTKGIAAMALSLLADRGLLEWDAPVATYWPAFAQNGKGAITLRALFGHRGGLAYLDAPLSLDDCLGRPDRVRRALEAQRPREPAAQAYHAVTYGMLAREIFERVAGESMGRFLRRELLEPLGSDVHLGAPAELDDRVATLYPPTTRARLANAVAAQLHDPHGADARVLRALLGRDSIARRAFSTPSNGARGLLAYNDAPVRRAELAWASATGSARGVARAYLPFASGGVHEGRRFLGARTVEALHDRDGWSERDAVLQKPLGWNRGFLKEEPHVVSPNRASFGHAGMGGALGWCDPVAGLAIGYVMNRMDWRVRSPRALAYCRAVYACEPVTNGARSW